MDKYRKVIKPKEGPTEKADEEIRVTAAGSVTAYVARANTVFTELSKTEVVITASGNALTKAVTTAEVIKRRFKGLHQITKVGSTEIVDEYEPLEEGLDKVTDTRSLAIVEIKLSQEPLDTSDKGYQAPIDESLVSEFDPDKLGRGGGRGKGSGRGKGRGKGKGKGKGKAEPEPKGKGKGKGKGKSKAEPEPAKGKGKGKGKSKAEPEPAKGKGKKGKSKAEPEPAKGKGKKGKSKGRYEEDYDYYSPPSKGKGKGKSKGKSSSYGYDYYDDYYSPPAKGKGKKGKSEPKGKSKGYGGYDDWYGYGSTKGSAGKGKGKKGGKSRDWGW